MSELLDIPTFLLTQEDVRKTVSFSDKKARTKEVQLPERGTWDLYWIHVGNHIRLGSGRRLVYAWIGRKWVHIIERPSGRRTKVFIAVWDKFRPERVEE